MKTINKEIGRLCFEIIIALVIVIGTHFMWNNLSINNYRTIASNSYVNTIAIKESSILANDVLIPQSYEQALKSQMGYIEVENLVNITQEYNLIIVISKTSTLDFNILNIIIDETEYKLKEQTRLEDEEYYYILLNNGSVKDTNRHQIKMYLDEDISTLEESKILNYYFEIKEYNSIFANK